MKDEKSSIKSEFDGIHGAGGGINHGSGCGISNEFTGV